MCNLVLLLDYYNYWSSITMEALSASSLPPGFGFHPTDVELISHYLKRKMLGLKIDFEVIPEIDIYKHEPWDLPARCNVPTRDSKWHFFAARDKKYPNGSRSNRATKAGYWKSTGKDRSIKHQKRVIGTKKTLVFHEGRPPCGKRSDWIMHEYYINENECEAAPDMKDAFVLCRVTKRDGWGLGGDNVSPQSDNVQSEKVDDCSEQPEDVASSAVPEKSSSPSESAEDIEAWFAELFDPNFSGEVKSEPEEGVTSHALKEEPNNPYLLPEVPEDSHLLFPVEEFYDILQSDTQSYVFGELDKGDMSVFGELDMGYMSAFGYQQEDMHACLNNNEYATNDENTDSWTGIQRRDREVKPYAATTNRRIKLQASKMESRNGETVRGTIRVNQGVHLDPYDEKQVSSRSVPGGVNVNASNSSARSGSSCLRGFMKGLSDIFARCSSASKNCFFLFACMVGTAALIFCFLLRDARCLISSFSALEL